jgi:hypothetical protein
MPILLNRDELRVEFNAAVQELLDRGLTNPLLTTPWYSEIGDSVFDACYCALEDARDLNAHKGFPGTPYSGSKRARMHVVSAPVGSGKTSFTLAFIAAVVRFAERHDDAPYGCLFVVDQIPRADQIYRDLNVLIPDRVGVWSTDHDASPGRKEPTKVLNPAATFTKEELKDKAVAIVTHAFFTGNGSYKARRAFYQGRMQQRALTVIDERIEGVTVFDVDLVAAAKVKKLIEHDESAAEAIGPHIDALFAFMSSRDLAGGGSLEKPTTQPEAWTKAEHSVQWFASPQAALYAKSHPGNDGVRAVFGFAKSLATGYAFINRQQGTHFIGYETNLVIDPGTVLLDATSDIDGISQLCPWREHREVPHARYDNLQIVHVSPHTTKNLATYLKSAKNRRAYVDWLVSTIRQHMEPGQKGLVVVKKALIDNENVPDWPTGDERHSNHKLFTQDWGWEIDGRKLCVVHWGTGIGDNTWKDADVVFLCDDFYLPKRTVIASAQGWRNHKSTEGDLGSMKARNSKAPAVDILQEGHVLRWTKQMALRGKGRNYDEHGVCGHQKLVYSGDLKKVRAYADVLFPGAHIECVRKGNEKQTLAEALLALLGRPNLPTRLPHWWLSEQMGAQWRDVGKNVMKLEYVKREVKRLGWTYVARKGRGGSYFERTGTTTVAAKAA